MKTGIMLCLAAAAVMSATTTAAAPTDHLLVRARDLRVREVGGVTEPDGWNVWSIGRIGDWFTVSEPGRVRVRVTMFGTPAESVFPVARLLVEGPAGALVYERTLTVSNPSWMPYEFAFEAAPGRHFIAVEFTNDLFSMRTNEDRNLHIRDFEVRGAGLDPRPPTVKELTDPDIRKHRMGMIRVLAAPGTRVRVVQQRHEFRFGTVVSDSVGTGGFSPEDLATYRRVLADNFNAASFENALDWRHIGRNGTESPDYACADSVLAFCEGLGIPVRGHSILHAMPDRVPEWLTALDAAALREAVHDRVRGVTERYRGRIREYDLNREMVVGRFYQDRLGEDIVADLFRWAREGDPDAVLCLDDHSILEGIHLERYARQIQGFLDNGFPVGGIGCYGRFNRPIPYSRLTRSLDRLAEFGLPVTITEFDMAAEDESARAAGLEEFFRTCFAHSTVQGIYLAGFWEGAHPRAGDALWRRDWTPTAAADACRRLVFDEWWTDWEGVVGSDGVCEVPAFYGTYRITARGIGIVAELRRAEGAVVVTFQ